MENLTLSIQFRPPPPYSVGGYFDLLTKDKYTEQYFHTMQNIFAFDIDGVMNIIHARQSPAEKAALLDILETRLRSHGETRGYLEPPKERATSASAVLTNFMIKDIMGLTGEPAEQKAKDKIQDLVRKFIDLGLNDRGKSQLTFLKWVWDVASAQTAEDRWRQILAKANEKLTKELLSHKTTILRAMARRGPVPTIVVDRLRKIIALRMAWRVTLATRFTWVNPVLFGLDLLLTPSEIGSDFKIAFLGIYTRVCEDRRILQSTLIERCGANDWKYKFDPVDVLRSAIRSG